MPFSWDQPSGFEKRGGLPAILALPIPSILEVAGDSHASLEKYAHYTKCDTLKDRVLDIYILILFLR